MKFCGQFNLFFDIINAVIIILPHVLTLVTQLGCKLCQKSLMKLFIHQHLLRAGFTVSISGLYYKTITIVIDAPSVVKSDTPNCSVTY